MNTIEALAKELYDISNVTEMEVDGGHSDRFSWEDLKREGWIRKDREALRLREYWMCYAENVMKAYPEIKDVLNAYPEVAPEPQKDDEAF